MSESEINGLRAIVREQEERLTKAFGCIGELQRQMKILVGIINRENGRPSDRRLTETTARPRSV